MNKRIFIILLGIYLVLLVTKKLMFFTPELINSYLTDLLCLPIVLSLCLYCIRWIKNDRHIQFNAYHVIFVVVVFSVVFEVYLPARHPEIYTADYVDIMLYAVGGVFYYVLQQEEKRKAFLSYILRNDELP